MFMKIIAFPEVNVKISGFHHAQYLAELNFFNSDIDYFSNELIRVLNNTKIELGSLEKTSRKKKHILISEIAPETKYARMVGIKDFIAAEIILYAVGAKSDLLKNKLMLDSKILL